MSAALPPAGGSYALDFQLERGCLRAHIGGRLASQQEILAMFLEVGAEVRRTGATMMLMVDDTQRDVPDAAQFLMLVQAVEGAGFAGVRLAYVDRRGGEVAQLQANELVAVEQGYVLKVFESEALATIWLRYGVD